MSDEKPVEAQTEKTKKRKISSVSKPVLLLSVLLVASLAVGGFMTLKYQNAKKNPQSLVQADQNKLVDKVGALINLPKDEEPSIATVSDKEKLKEQAFFKEAENGDTLLIYTKAKKAILYRESANRVVEVAPIAIDTNQAGTETNSEAKPQ